MIISKTPLRISFVGGGSDLPVYYRKHGGAVVSTSIDKYVYITVNKKFDDRVRVSYSKTEEVEKIEQLQHALVRSGLQMLGIPGGIEITSIADVPSKGTGLGSSSSFTVGLLNALHAFVHNEAGADKLAKQACEIEIDICKAPIGKQDQYAAAFGGLNLIEFGKDESVKVTPIVCKPQTTEKLQENLIAFYTGITRSADSLLAKQNVEIHNNSQHEATLKKMTDLASELKSELERDNLDAFGKILHQNWELKKSLLKEISDPRIDGWYDSAIAAGATGGKLLGAGQGGFLLFYAPTQEARAAVTEALSELKPFHFKFENEGSRILFVYNNVK